jgi:hypothetical protein
MSSSTQNLECTEPVTEFVRAKTTYNVAAQQLISILQKDPEITINNDEKANDLIHDICNYVVMNVNGNMYIIYDKEQQLYKINNYHIEFKVDVNRLIPQLLNIGMLKEYTPPTEELYTPPTQAKKTKRWFWGGKKTKSKKNKSKKNKTRRNRK